MALIEFGKRDKALADDPVFKMVNTVRALSNLSSEF